MSDETIRDIFRQVNVFVAFSDIKHISNDHWDLVFTTERLVFVKADERRKFGMGGGLITCLLGAALEKYQQATKDRKLDLEMINALIENELAVVAYPKEIKCVINQLKKSTTDHMLWMDTSCRAAFEGTFLFKNERRNGFLAFNLGMSKKEARKLIEDNFAVKAIVSDEKITKEWNLESRSAYEKAFGIEPTLSDLQEIGLKYGLSRERVDQILAERERRINKEKT